MTSQQWFEFEMLWHANSYSWNEICVWAIEQFGLPGDRYVTEVTTNCMKFKFRCPEDCVWMKLRWR